MLAPAALIMKSLSCYRALAEGDKEMVLMSPDLKMGGDFGAALRFASSCAHHRQWPFVKYVA